MFLGLLIRDGNGAELNLISHACDNAASCVDYSGIFVVHAEREGVRPDEQVPSPRHNDAVSDANGGIDL